MDLHIKRNYPTFLNIATPNCATTDPDAFFLERGASTYEVQMAKRVCESCVLIGACREWAIENHEIGIWGGTTEVERKRLRRMRNAVKEARNSQAS